MKKIQKMAKLALTSAIKKEMEKMEKLEKLVLTKLVTLMGDAMFAIGSESIKAIEATKNAKTKTEKRIGRFACGLGFMAFDWIASKQAQLQNRIAQLQNRIA